MKAIWYDGFGPAKDVLTFGEMADPEPGPGEVLLEVRRAGICGSRRLAQMWTQAELASGSGFGMRSGSGPLGRRLNWSLCQTRKRCLCRTEPPLPKVLVSAFRR